MSNKVAILTDHLTVMCCFSNLALQFHLGVVLLNLLQLLGSWLLRILVVFGSMKKMALVMLLSAQVGLQMFWLVITMVDRGEHTLVIGYRTVVQLGHFLFGLKLVMQLVNTYVYMLQLWDVFSVHNFVLTILHGSKYVFRAAGRGS